MQILTSDRAYQLPCIQGKERRTVSFFSFPPLFFFSRCSSVWVFVSPPPFLKRNLEIFGGGKKPFVGEAKDGDYLIESPGCGPRPRGVRARVLQWGGEAPGPGGQGRAEIAPHAWVRGAGGGGARLEPAPVTGGLWRAGAPGAGGCCGEGISPPGVGLIPPVINSEEERQFVVKSIVRSQVK